MFSREALGRDSEANKPETGRSNEQQTTTMVACSSSISEFRLDVRMCDSEAKFEDNYQTSQSNSKHRLRYRQNVYAFDAPRES